MKQAINDYLRLSNEHFVEMSKAQEEKNRTSLKNQKNKIGFRDEYSFYQNLD